MKKIKNLVAAAIATAMLSGAAIKVLAVDTLDFSVPTYIYGAGLKGDQIRQTAELLGIQSLDGMTMAPITGKELYKYIGVSGIPDSGMISSVAVVKENEGSGIDVNITTPENITQIEKYQYENACITAGINDVYVAVGAIRPVTGESALAGIYKAFAINNVALNKDRMEVAQEELEVTNKVIQQQKEAKKKDEKNVNSNNNNNNTTVINNTEINSTQTINNIINQVMVDVKTEIAVNAKEGKELTEDDIKKLIEEKLKEVESEKNKITLTEEQLKMLTDFFDTYNKKVVPQIKDDDTTQKQLDDLKKKVDNLSNASNTSNTSNADTKGEDTATEQTTTAAVKKIVVPEALKTTEKKSITTAITTKGDAEVKTTAPVITTEENPKATTAPIITKGDTPMETTVEATKTESTVPETNGEIKTIPSNFEGVNPIGITNYGFTEEKLPKEVMALLKNFPQGTQFSYFISDMKTAPFSEEAVRNLKDKAKILPLGNMMINEYLDTVKDGEIFDYWTEGTQSKIWFSQGAKVSNTLESLFVRSPKEMAGDDGTQYEYPILNKMSRMMASTYLESLGEDEVALKSRIIIDMLAKEVAGNPKQVAVADVGSGILVMAATNNNMNLWYVDKNSGAVVDYKNAVGEYKLKVLTVDDKIETKDGAGTEETTTVPQNTSNTAN